MTIGSKVTTIERTVQGFCVNCKCYVCDCEEEMRGYFCEAAMNVILITFGSYAEMSYCAYRLRDEIGIDVQEFHNADLLCEYKDDEQRDNIKIIVKDFSRVTQIVDNYKGEQK